MQPVLTTRRRAFYRRLTVAVKQHLGTLDGIWFNAGYTAVNPIQEVNAEFFDRMMLVNVKGPVLQLATLLDLLNPNASIVITSSSAAYEKSPMASIYAATKGALISLTHKWAIELADKGIRVNVILPGIIETDFRHFMSESQLHAFEDTVIDNVPLARKGTPEEAAKVGLFLLSDDASYVTGSQYAVDGGLIMH